MAAIGYSGARRKLISEKNLTSKISCQTPFKGSSLMSFTRKGFLVCEELGICLVTLYICCFSYITLHTIPIKFPLICETAWQKFFFWFCSNLCFFLSVSVVSAVFRLVFKLNQCTTARSNETHWGKQENIFSPSFEGDIVISNLIFKTKSRKSTWATALAGKLRSCANIHFWFN